MTRIATTGVDHIDLCVGDLARSEPFYDLVLTALGFRKVSDGDTKVWRGPHLEIGLRAAETPTTPGGYDRYRVGLHHLALRAESREAVDRFHRFLSDNEIEILDAPAAYPQYGADYYAVFFADPDGMKLEFVHRPSDWESGS